MSYVISAICSSCKKLKEDPGCKDLERLQVAVTDIHSIAH